MSNPLINKLERDIQTYMDMVNSDKTVFINDIVGLRFAIMRRFVKRHSNHRPLPLDSLGVVATRTPKNTMNYYIVGDVDLMSMGDTFRGHPWVAAYTMANMYDHIVGSRPLVNVKMQMEEAEPAPLDDQLFVDLGDYVPTVPDIVDAEIVEEVSAVEEEPTPIVEVVQQRELDWRGKQSLLHGGAGGQIPSTCEWRVSNVLGDVQWPVAVRCVQNKETIEILLESEEGYILLEPFGVATITYMEDCRDWNELSHSQTRRANNLIVDPMPVKLPARAFSGWRHVSDDCDNKLSFDMFVNNLGADDVLEVVAVPRHVMVTDTLTWSRLPKFDTVDFSIDIGDLIHFHWEPTEIIGAETPSQQWWVMVFINRELVATPASLMIEDPDEIDRKCFVDGVEIEVEKPERDIHKVDTLEYKVEGVWRRKSDNRRFEVERIINTPTYRKGVPPAHYLALYQGAHYVAKDGVVLAVDTTAEKVLAKVGDGYTRADVKNCGIKPLFKTHEVSSISRLVPVSVIKEEGFPDKVTFELDKTSDNAAVVLKASLENSVVVMHQVTTDGTQGKTNCVLFSEFFDGYVKV